MISRQIDEDREQACDDIAVSVTGNPTDLVRGLAALRLGTTAPALAMAADGGPLLTRLNRLMGRPVSRTRSAPSRLSAAAASALLLGTAAISTVSMAHPHPPVVTDVPEAPEMLIPETVIRATAPEQPHTPAPLRVTEHPQVYAANIASLPPMPAMPEMPVIPAVPTMPAVMPPVFGDYNSEEAFEAAMETWGETMEVWGDEVEQRFEGDWEDRMDAWGEEMEVWGEAVEDLTEDLDGNGFEALAALDGLAGLSELAALADLSALENGVFVLDDDKVDAKAEEIRARILSQIETRMRDSERTEEQVERSVERAERARERIEEQAEREQERAQERMEREQERAQERMARTQEMAHERAQEQAERMREREDRYAELHMERDRRTTEHNARSQSHSSTESRSQHTTTISGAGPEDRVRINGNDIHIGQFRRTLMAALVEDGLVDPNERNIILSMCDDLTVNGRDGTDAQYRRYQRLLADIGLGVSGSVVIKLKPESLYLNLSGSDNHDDGLEATFGTYEHTPNK